MNENILRRWAWQILEGLVYLHGHEPPIVHRWGYGSVVTSYS